MFSTKWFYKAHKAQNFDMLSLQFVKGADTELENSSKSANTNSVLDYIYY